MYIALISSGSRFTIGSLCTKNILTISICWGMIAKLPGVTSTSQGQKFQKFEEYPKSVRIKMADLAGR